MDPTQKMAAHVRTAITRNTQPTVQAKHHQRQGGRPVAPHVLTAIATAVTRPVLQPASHRSESCEATLYIGRRSYEGSTGQGCGHAEMHALQQFVVARGEEAARELRDLGKKVQCESRPVCSQCGAVLQELGFEAYSGATTWSEKTMGKTEWSVTPTLRKFLEGQGIDVDEIRRMRPGTI